jgi:hypothetical protein
MYGGGMALEENKPLPQVLLQAGAGAALGKGGGVLFKSGGAALGGFGKNIQTLAEKGQKTLRESAAKQYGQVLNPTTKLMKQTTQKILPEIQERKLTSGTFKGLLSKAEQGAEAAGDALSVAYDALPANARVKVNPILSKISEAQDNLVVKGTNTLPEANKALHQALGNLKQELLDMTKVGPKGEVMSIEAIRSYRQVLDAAIKGAGKGFGFNPQDKAVLGAQKEMANAIRNELSKQFPNIGSINKELTFWLRLKDVLSATAERRTGQATPLGEKIMAGAGAAGGLATGGVQGAAATAWLMSQLTKLTGSTAWKTTSAKIKLDLAEALAKGETTTAGKIVQGVLTPAGKVLEKAGQAVEKTIPALRTIQRTSIVPFK